MSEGGGAAREAQRIARTVARVHFKTTLAGGLAAVHQLDVLVANRLEDDPAALAVWDNARRVDYRTRADTPEASPTPATPPTKDAPTPPVTPASTMPGDKAA